MDIRTMKAKRAILLDEAKTIQAGALNDESRARLDGMLKDASTLKEDIARAETLEAELAEAAQPDEVRGGRGEIGAPNLNLTTQRGETENSPFFHYLRTGKVSRELRASNANDMTIADVTYEGYAVPTGLYQSIVARRDQVALFGKLGCLPIPGKGTTVNVAFDNAAAAVFVSTGETTAFDLDAPVIGQAAMTLVKYTKKLQMSVELMEDEDAKLSEFLENYVGRAWGLTENSLLCTEILANGTSNTLGATAAATAADIPLLTYALKAEYADGAQWLMARATEGKYRALQGSDFLFAPMPQGNPNGNVGGDLWGAPMNNSSSMPAVGSGNKSIAFGNFAFVGRREGTGMQVLRDPYSSAGTGQVNVFYYIRVVYKVLIAEAIQYGKHTTT